MYSCCTTSSGLVWALIVFMTSLHAFVLLPSVNALEYEPGVNYEYEYIVSLRLTDPRRFSTSTLKTPQPNPANANVKSPSEVASEIRANIHVTCVWKNPDDAGESLLLFKLNPRLRVKPKGELTVSDHVSPLDTKTHHPFAVVLNEGRISRFLTASDDDEDLINLKRGLASLFQLQNDDKEEVDVSGKCNIRLKNTGKHIKKIKSSCVYPTVNGSTTHLNKVLGVDLKSGFETIYTFHRDKPVIQAVDSKERYVLEVASIDFATTVVHSSQKLSLLTETDVTKPVVEGSTLKKAIESLSKELSITLTQNELTLTEDRKTCRRNCKSFSETVKDYKDIILPKHLAKVKFTSAFLKLVQRCRQATKDDILKVLTNEKHKKILPVLYEIAAAAQTESSVDAIFEVLPKVNDASIAERTLLALALSPKPMPASLTYLRNSVAKNKFKSDKVQNTAILVLGALVRGYCLTLADEKCETDKVADDVLQFLTSSLEKCSQDSCFQTYLRSLRNAGQPSSLPVLLEHAKKGGKQGLWALQAIKQLPSSVITADVKADLLRIFNNLVQRYDSTSRLLAVDTILRSNPTKEEVMRIIGQLSALNEMSTYLGARIKELSQNNEELKKIVNSALKDPQVGNYDVLAQPGISTAFTRLLTGSDEGNATYGVHLQLGKGGAMKQSSFDVELNNPEGHLQLLSFGLFAGGLSSISGSSTTDDGKPSREEDDDDEGDATAGLELTVMGVSLRPYVFFVGQGELMGHVWSGTGSEPTLILQGNSMLHNYGHQVALQSGLMLDLRVSGGLSVDMSGSVQISLWNRNAHSEIKTKTAVMVQGSATIDTNFLSTSIEFSLATEPKLNFITDTEFYESPFKMCTQMSQPQFPFRYNVRKIERIPNSKHSLRRSSKLSKKIFGRSFALHPKNSALCEVMLKSTS